MLTAKGKYGLKALIHLAQMPPGELAGVQDIATANNIPKKFLDAILGDLRNAGFVQGTRVLLLRTPLALVAGRVLVVPSADCTQLLM